MIRLLLLFFFFSSSLYSGDLSTLKLRIDSILSGKNARVGIAISGINPRDTLFYHKHELLPTLSVYKFPIAIAVLAKVDEGKLSLNQKITIKESDMPKNTWSPIRDKFPAGATLTLAEIIQYTISQSDNIGCDEMLKLMGGTGNVQVYFEAMKLNGIRIGATEVEMHEDYRNLYKNLITPFASNELLRMAYHPKFELLKAESREFLWKCMKETTTGPKRIPGLLPEETIVGHKTGSSGANDQGVTAACNDIGIIFLPDGKPIYISVFVTDSRETTETNERMIAEIAQAAFIYFSDAQN